MPNKFFLLIILFLFGSVMSFSQERPRYSDGPYIFDHVDQYEVMWIDSGEYKTNTVLKSEKLIFSESNLPQVDLSDLSFYTSSQASFVGVSKFAAISDVHGQFDVFIKLLKAQDIIGKNNQWKYNDGHLVIVGDIFDRGDKVTECLWFLFRLEKEAKKAGGAVHFLLGNHELMILHNDLRYLAPKYKFTAGISDVKYPDLYGKNTVLGQWLRTKKVSVSINDAVFVHGGFSKAVIEKESSLQTINDIFKEKIIDHPELENTSDGSLLSMLAFNNGPLWYREYANPDGFDSLQANYILDRLDKNTLIVGHTSMPTIRPINGLKIILIDSSIKFGRGGEILMYDSGTYYRGLIYGERIQLTPDGGNLRKPSAFDYIYEIEDRELTIRIKTDLKDLLSSSSKEKKDYITGSLTAIHSLENNRVWDIKLKARGNIRKSVCKFPPLKIDHSKKVMERLGFAQLDKLKVVMQCEQDKAALEVMYREHFVYELYKAIDTLGFRTKLINIDLWDEDQPKYFLKGFFLESEKEHAYQNGTTIIENGMVNYSGLDRDHYLKMCFFQYLIRNTDWSISNKHNVEIVAIPGQQRVVAIPYDFDYAGMVGAKYAVPHEKIPVSSVSQAYFRGKEVTLEEVESMRLFYNNFRSDLNQLVTDNHYLSARSKRQILKYFESFYKDLNNENKHNSLFIQPTPFNQTKK